MRSKVTTAPTIEPVTLDELKSALRITHSAEDTLLTQFIEDARIFCERYTGRKFITQTITAYYDSIGARFLDDWWSGTRKGAVTQISTDKHAVLEFTPVQSITSVATFDESNNETAYASSNYYLDNYDDDLRAKMIINDGSTITYTRNENGIKIVYVAGYGSNTTDVPSSLRRAVLLMAAHLHANRGDCDEECAAECGALPMLKSYKLENVGGLR